MKIAILGGGSWGTALAMHLARKDYNIKIWEFFLEQVQEMQENRVCPLLPEVKLPENIFVSNELEEVLQDSEMILLVVPSDKIGMTLDKAAKVIQEQPIVICSKGFGDNLKLLNEIVAEKVKGKVYCLYGPTHAEEVCKGRFSGIVLAGPEGQELKKEIEGENLKVDLTEDIIGVQVAAALKNILAVFIGVLDGMKLGDNAKAYVMTKGLAEIKQVGLKWGGQPETFSGLAGMGDLIVTCTSQHSRNRHVGEQVGKGKQLDEVLKEMKMVAEGVNLLGEVPALKEKFDLELPLMSGLYQIMFEGKNPEEVLKQL